MLNRYLSILSAVAIGLALSATNALAADNKIQEIKNAGMLRMCMAEGLPANMKNPETQKWEGYNVDMGNHLAEIMGTYPENLPERLSRPSAFGGSDRAA